MGLKRIILGFFTFLFITIFSVHAMAVEYPFIITTTPDTTQFGFNISATGTFYVDWGDGKTETINKTTTSEQTISHTYTSAKSYTVKLGGKATGYSSDVNISAFNFFSNYNSYAPKVATIQGSIGQIFSTLPDTTQPRFINLFNGCTNLEALPENLFSGISGAPAPHMFISAFQDCRKLTYIPEYIFKDIKGAPSKYMFSSAFKNATGLQSIPKNLFASFYGKPAQNMFSWTFYGAKGLSGFIPPTLFAGIDRPNVATATDQMKDVFRDTGLDTTCPTNYYVYDTGFNSNFSSKVPCTICPNGYADNKPDATNLSQCTMTVSSGFYIKNPGDTTPTICPAGSYCTGGNVIYNKTSSPIPCPSNSTSGTGASSCTCNTGYNYNGGTTTSSNPCVGNTYTIVYDKNGGSGTMSNTACTYGSNCTLHANAFTKTGHVFAGWIYNGTEYSDGASINILPTTNGATIMFTAQWTPETYTLTLDKNGATSGDTSATTQYGASGFCSTGSKTDTTCSLNVYTPYRTGYIFNGYFTEQTGGTMWIDANGYPVTPTTITSSRTLYAQWTPKTYTLTLDRNGATDGDTSATTQYGANGFCDIYGHYCELSILKPHRPGYTFDGYFTEQTGGTMWINANGYPVTPTTITSSRTLYAQWTPEIYTCPAGEYLSGTSCTTCPTGSYCPGVTNQKYTGGDIGVITCPANSTSGAGASECTCNTGYNYNGDTTTSSNPCVANTYTLTYSANNGSGTMDDKICTYGQDCIVDGNKFSRTGYTFNGWTCYGDICRGGTPISTSENFKNRVTTNNVKIQIAAQWKENIYTCPAGEYLSGTSCTTCPTGSYCPGVTNQKYTGGDIGVITCPANSTSGAGASECTCNEYFTTTGLAGGATNTTNTVCKLVPKFTATTTAETDYLRIQISDVVGTFYIDWGDGSPVEKRVCNFDGCTENYTNDIYEFLTPGEHIIKVSGLATDYDDSDDGTGTLDGTLQFQPNTLKTIDGSLSAIFPTAPNGKNAAFISTFGQQQYLTGEIPENLFSGLHGQARHFMFHRLLWRVDTPLKLPNNLFANVDLNTAPHMFASMITQSTELYGELSNNFFAGINGEIKSGMFAYTFEDCPGLTGQIPENLFNRIDSNGNVVGITGAPVYEAIFDNTFSGCSGLTGNIPEQLFTKFDDNGNIIGGIQGEPATTMFQGTFYGCSGLSGSIPENLFAGITGAPTYGMFSSTFNGCSGLSSFIPPKLFKNINIDPSVTSQMIGIFHDSGIVTQCPVGYYQYMTGFEEYFNNRVSCTPCPTGYQDAGPGLTAEYQCIQTVEPGYYIKTPGDITPTQCPNGSYCTGGDVSYGAIGPINPCPAVTNTYGAALAKFMSNDGFSSSNNCMAIYTFAEKFIVNEITSDTNSEYSSESNANKRGTYYVACHYNPTSGNYDTDCLSGYPIYTGCGSGYYFINSDKMDWNTGDAMQEAFNVALNTDTLEQSIEQICHITDVDHWSPGLQDCYNKYTTDEDRDACVTSKLPAGCTTDNFDGCAGKTLWSQHPCPENSSTRGLTGQAYCVCDDRYTVDGTVDGPTTTMYDACIRTKITVTYDVNGGNGAVASQTCTAGSSCDLKTPEQIGHDMYRPGYIFSGWALNEKDGSCHGHVCGIGYQYTFNKNTTVYAVWRPCANGTYKTADANAGDQCTACPAVTNPYGAVYTNTVEGSNDLNENGVYDSIDECVGEYTFAHKSFMGAIDKEHVSDSPANERGMYNVKCHYNPISGHYDIDCLGSGILYGCSAGYYFTNVDKIDWNDTINQDKNEYFVKTNTLEQAIEQICIPANVDYLSPGAEGCFEKYSSSEEQVACVLSKTQHCTTLDEQCALKTFWSQHPCPENSSTRGLTGQEYCTCDDKYTTDGTVDGPTTTMYDACIRTEVTITYDVNGGNGAIESHKCLAYDTCDIKTPSQIGHDMYRAGYVFDGWALNPGDTTPIDYQYTFNENTTVYAIWTPCANGTYKTADANAGDQCSACSDLGTEYTFTEIASTSANQCRAECVEHSIIYGTAIPLEQYKFWPNKCEYRGVSVTGNPCDIIDGECIETSCNYNYEMINGRCQACNREHALTYKPTGNCVVETCGYGYHADGQYCVGDTKACSAPNAISAHQVWDTKKNAFSECLITECESGYHVSENVCQLDDQTCELEHGTGEREWDDKTNSWGKCIATYCEPGYTNDPSLTNENWEQCGRCNNMYTTDGVMAVSSYVQGCEIASCMNQGEQFILDGDECRLICDEYSDETGRRYWDGKKCVHECTNGYTQW